MTVDVQHVSGTEFEAIARGHHVISDQPPENGGRDAGMTPPELLLASLGTCAGFYAAQYLTTRSLPTDGLRIRVHAKKSERAPRLGEFRIEVYVPMAPGNHETRLLRAVKACLIHNTLVEGAVVETVINGREDAERFHD
ncbi:MAG TPA: OsmC family protein [Bryobacteraceae bacterium]|nr:OsmC family protein [Bryobacteraceae bacterium]